MNTRTRKLVYTALLAALTAVGAFLRIPMVYSSVTLQYLFTAMAGLLLGRRWGALSQAVYVLLGLVGLPIFTMGGGFGYVFQPTFGFLLGLIPAAWVVGAVAGESLDPKRMALASLAGLAALVNGTAEISRCLTLCGWMAGFWVLRYVMHHASPNDPPTLLRVQTSNQSWAYL